jgi:hypothetical protein
MGALISPIAAKSGSVEDMRKLDLRKIRRKRWLLDRNIKIFRVEEAKEFIERLGLVSALTNEQLPSLAKAIYTEDLRSRFEVDQRLWDFVHILITKKWVYYGRILGGHNTLLSIKLLPYYIRLYPIPDYNHLFQQKLLSHMAKSIMDLLYSKGPLMTKQIRNGLGISSSPGKRRLTRSLTELQRKSLVCCSGKVAQDSCRWRFGLWAPTDKWLPRKVKIKARMLSDEEAKRKLVEKYVYTTTRTTPQLIGRFFNWPLVEVERIVRWMIDRELVSSYNHQGEEYLFKGNL